MAGIGCIVLSGCGFLSTNGQAGSVEGGERRQAANAPTEVVPVERRDIQPVELVSATVVAGPTVTVRAANDGVVTLVASSDEVLEQGAAIASIDGVEVTAPSGGQIGFSTVDGAVVDKGFPIATVTTSEFALVSTGSSGLGAELFVSAAGASNTVQAQVTEVSASFPCHVLTRAAGDGNEVGEQAVPDLVCMLPPELSGRVLEGLDGVIAVGATTATDVLALPITSVSGRDGMGQVARKTEDGTFELVDVTLGVSDGSWIEVEGLTEEDQVSALAPNLWW